MIDVFWHEDVLRHDGGAGVFGGVPSDLLMIDEIHVEGADRIRNIYSVLKRGPLKDSLRWYDGRHASRDELLAFHKEAYVDQLLRAETEGGRRYTWETVVAPGSTDSILAAAGTALSAMQHMLDGKGDLVYALVRPPGHHSSPDQADGYCFLNQVGLCAEMAGTAIRFVLYVRNRLLEIALHLHRVAHGPSGIGLQDETATPSAVRSAGHSSESSSSFSVISKSCSRSRSANGGNEYEDHEAARKMR